MEKKTRNQGGSQVDNSWGGITGGGGCYAVNCEDSMSKTVYFILYYFIEDRCQCYGTNLKKRKAITIKRMPKA